MALNRVQIAFTGNPTEGGGLATFYFDSSVGTVAQQMIAAQSFFSTTEGVRAPTCAWAGVPDVATIDEASGALTAVVSTATSSGVGTAAGVVLSPTTQGLLRNLSSVVVGGRLLRGRLFLPGATATHNVLGAPSSSYLTAYNGAASALIADPNTVWKIWSRTYGTSAAVTTANVWTKWAVLRSRRD